MATPPSSTPSFTIPETTCTTVSTLCLNDELSKDVPAGMGYGTAGFRALESRLDGVVLRMGMLAALRSMQRGKAVGVMVTASHNPIEDNGVKMIDSDGGMLVQAWEKFASQLAAASRKDVLSVLQSIVQSEHIQVTSSSSSSSPIQVVLGCDTRPSSRRLIECATLGAKALGAEVIDCGIVTTPQLHHIVRMHNNPPLIPRCLLSATQQAEAVSAGAAASTPSIIALQYKGEEGYYKMLVDGLSGVIDNGMEKSQIEGQLGPLVLDCANGVGGVKAAVLNSAAWLHPLGFHMQLRNTGATPEEAAKLNDNVGAEHAQKELQPPTGFSAAVDAGARCASLDGDADRVVYHFFDHSNTWHLLDGDKIACLAASFLGGLLADAGFTVTDVPTNAGGHHDDDDHGAAVGAGAAAANSSSSLSSLKSAAVSVGIVQTAYANGAATNYVASVLHLPVVHAKTGVKFVHAAAVAYDVGVYFEANGHGTVLFHPKFVAKLVNALETYTTPAELEAAVGAKEARALRRLFWSTVLINQAIGDALSDALLVEVILALSGRDVMTWDKIYTDLPSKQKKLAVTDRTAVHVNADETRVMSPQALQLEIDAAVAKYPNGRAFLRPSGTEDVVRVYAEASTREGADALADDVAAAAKRHC